jgi:hypothetical protein
MRMPSVLWGGVALASVGFIVRRLYVGRGAALVGVGVLAIDFGFVNGASDARMDMTCAALGAFDCTRRLTNGRYGLIALAILTCSFLPFYGYETRPYGLFGEFFPAGPFLLASIILAALAATRHSASVSPMSDGERLSWFFLSIPSAGYVLATVVTHGFHSRYFIGTLPGVALGFACLLYRHFGESRLISGAIIFLFVVFGLAHQVSKTRNPELIESFGDQQGIITRQLIEWEGTLQKEGKKYTAVSIGRLVWLEAWYYSKHPERYVAVLDAGASVGASSHYCPTPQWTLDELKQHAHETALVSPRTGVDPDNSYLQGVQDMGLRLKVRAWSPLEIFLFGITLWMLYPRRGNTGNVQFSLWNQS